MRLKSIVAALAAGMLNAVVLASPAAAWGWDPSVAPEGHDTIIHRVYKPRYTHVYHGAAKGDPYAYRYARRAYYPYYASHYWGPAENMRYRYRTNYHLPKYVPAWGAGHHHDHGHSDGRPLK
jgi:hypothetical protein